MHLHRLPLIIQSNPIKINIKELNVFYLSDLGFIWSLTTSIYYGLDTCWNSWKKSWMARMEQINPSMQKLLNTIKRWTLNGLEEKGAYMCMLSWYHITKSGTKGPKNNSSIFFFILTALLGIFLNSKQIGEYCQETRIQRGWFCFQNFLELLDRLYCCWIP